MAGAFPPFALSPFFSLLFSVCLPWGLPRFVSVRFGSLFSASCPSRVRVTLAPGTGRTRLRRKPAAVETARHTERARSSDIHNGTNHHKTNTPADKKAREAMASQAKGKGPMNTGQQGIKKSGKK